ncbi:thiamine phosphate synthase [Rubritalea spongiae]|uniref:Thiamine-phosphate synthase n=1 Tax=Rubritalea spongiae TaxID=430797 RepID=A0ABW5DYT1_9BACT
MKSKLNDALLYGIVDMGYTNSENVEAVAHALVKGGAGIIQLRAKGVSAAEIERLALLIQPVCKAADVPFIVNDFPAIAKKIGADGVHIGQDDGTLEQVRAVVGEEMIVGRSTHSPDQAEDALLDGFDYIGFGPLFPTPTKKGRPGIGVDEVKRVQGTIGTRIPVFCIGGIKRDNLEEVIGAGARRVVIVSDILGAEDIFAAAQSVVDQLGKAE